MQLRNGGGRSGRWSVVGVMVAFALRSFGGVGCRRVVVGRLLACSSSSTSRATSRPAGSASGGCHSVFHFHCSESSSPLDEDNILPTYRRRSMYAPPDHDPFYYLWMLIVSAVEGLDLNFRTPSLPK